MQKVGLALTLGFLFLTGSVLADVDCGGLQACQMPSPDPDSVPQPALTLNVTEDQTIPVSVSFWGAPDCQGDPDSSFDGSASLAAGQNVLGLGFMSGLDMGMQVSIQWTVGNCPQTECINYVVGDSNAAACFNINQPVTDSNDGSGLTLLPIELPINVRQ